MQDKQNICSVLYAVFASCWRCVSSVQYIYVKVLADLNIEQGQKFHRGAPQIAGAYAVI